VILGGFHGCSAVDVVSRVWSRREDEPEKSEREHVTGIAERSARQDAVVEKKAARPEIIDPRAWWEQEEAYRAYGGLA
jgi:hypothetical protein